VTVCACDWLVFVFFYFYSLWDMTYDFNFFEYVAMNISVIVWRRGMVFIQLITAEIFRHQHWLLPSRTHQTSWCTNQGIQQGHIPLPKRKLQPVCYWQPTDYRNHPEIKCTCSKIHNNLCPLVLHKELKIRADGWTYMQQK